MSDPTGGDAGEKEAQATEENKGKENGEKLSEGDDNNNVKDQAEEPKADAEKQAQAEVPDFEKLLFSRLTGEFA